VSDDPLPPCILAVGTPLAFPGCTPGTRITPRLTPSLLVLLSLTTAGCSDMAMSGDYGLAPGGQQGVDEARDLVESGAVPAPEDITVEGLLNEHDMPITGVPCEETVCVNLAAGTGRLESLDQASVLLQVGYDTNIDPETFVRPDTEFTVVIDVSGSMEAEIAPIQRALRTLTTQLTPNDSVAIVTYGSTTEVLLAPTSGANTRGIQQAINALHSNGSTNMEAGLELGYATARSMAAGSPEEKNARVLLFTDEQPNTGATDPASFKGIIQAGADAGIGLTMLGIGDSFGTGLAYEIGDLRGGNWKYLATDAEVEAVFTNELAFLVTPVAYDLALELQAAAPLEAAYNVQGAGNSADGDGAVVSAHVTTLFLSSGHGASVLQLAASGLEPGQVDVAAGTLTFETVTGEIVTREIAGALGDEAGGYGEDAFAQAGTRKAAALINEGLTAIELCTAYRDGDMDTVIGHVEATAARLESEAEALDDDGLRAELAFFLALMDNAGM